VAIGPLQLSVVDLARFGLERLGDDFPIRTEQPPMQMPVETFDRARQMVMPTLALLSGPPPVRLWFQSEDMTRLVQVQRDWLACNWQAGATGAPYPRYEANEASFYETWDSLSEFVESLGQGPLTASQCELTYVNHITPGELWSRHGEMNKVIRLRVKREPSCQSQRTATWSSGTECPSRTATPDDSTSRRRPQFGLRTHPR
jgi:uncharacterized protein (TIGR04255 family)